MRVRIAEFASVICVGEYLMWPGGHDVDTVFDVLNYDPKGEVVELVARGFGVIGDYGVGGLLVLRDHIVCCDNLCGDAMYYVKMDMEGLS